VRTLHSDMIPDLKTFFFGVVAQPELERVATLLTSKAQLSCEDRISESGVPNHFRSSIPGRSFIALTTNQAGSTVNCTLLHAHPLRMSAENPENFEDLQEKFGRFRILIVGRANAGKTTILRGICNSTENPEIYDSDGNKVWIYVEVCCHVVCETSD